MRIEVLRGDAAVAAAFVLMATLRDRIREETFLAEIRRQAADGYELIAAFDGDEMVALAGMRPGHTLARGEHIFVDDLVTAAPHRGRGHARALLAWIARRAAAAGIRRVYLDSRDTARGFYADAGFTFLTSVPCFVEASALD
jgi:GNAT superfamily N-acetyltransferase